MTEYIKIDEKSALLNYLKEFEVCFPHLKEKVEMDEYSEKLANYAENYIMLVDEKRVGITCFYANDFENFCGYITLIGISPNAQKGGLGKEIINFTFSKMKEKGMKFVKLEVDKDNINAIGFYEHLGFKLQSEAKGSLYLARGI